MTSEASASRRPRVICHMIASIDGRIVTGRWPDLGEGWGEYERTGSTYGADAWMCGRITMEAMAGGLRESEEVARESASRPRDGLIDEVSLLVAPVADGAVGTATLFDVGGDDVVPRRLALESVERRASDVLWLRYRVEGRTT